MDKSVHEMKTRILTHAGYEYRTNSRDARLEAMGHGLRSAQIAALAEAMAAVLVQELHEIRKGTIGGP
jgi:hypothetical protein